MENKSKYELVFHKKEHYPNWNQFEDWTEILENGNRIGWWCEELGECFFKNRSYESLTIGRYCGRIEVLSVEDDKITLYDKCHCDFVTLEYKEQELIPVTDDEDDFICCVDDLAFGC